MNSVLIHQPEYIPWSNFFLKFKHVENYVFLDSVQYNKRSFQNRNFIKTKFGQKYLTVPIKKSPQSTKIMDIQIDYKNDWITNHLEILKENYKKSKFFDKIFPELQEIYYEKNWKFLFDFKISLKKFFLRKLDLNLKFYLSSSFNLTEKKSDLMLRICKELKVDTYITGTGSKNYLNKKNFENEKIKLIYVPPQKIIYDQQYMNLGFTKELSFIDYIFNCGFEKFRKDFLY